LLFISTLSPLPRSESQSKSESKSQQEQVFPCQPRIGPLIIRLVMDSPPAPPATDVTAAAPAAAPSGFLFQVLHSATDLVKSSKELVAAIVVLVATVGILINPGEKLPPGMRIWAAGSLIGLCLLYGLIVQLQRRRQQRHRELLIAGHAHARHFLLAPRDAADHATFNLPGDTHLFVTAWLRAAPFPLLHLRGDSGTGKSSLIHAWIVPELEGDFTHRVLVLRAFDAPLDRLREALLDLWETKKAREDRATLDLFPLLQAAAAHLKGKQQRLLIIFDQFEEYFLLSPEPERTTALHDLLHLVLQEPPPGLCVLLSYRTDQQKELAPLHLPPVSTAVDRNLQVNGFTLSLFSEAEARDFLKTSGLDLSDRRVQLGIEEASSYEIKPRQFRPIVLNLLGRILSTLRGSPQAVSQKRGLIRGQVRDWVLTTALREDIRPLLEALITDAGTARPVPESALAAAVRRPVADLQPVLGDLETYGLLRRLNPAETAPEKRLWQPSHDFIAQIFSRITESLQKTLLLRLAPWLAPAALLLWLLGALVIWPIRQERWAMTELSHLGFSYDVNTREVMLQGDLQFLVGAKPDDPTIRIITGPPWSELTAALRGFRCRKLIFRSWQELFTLHDLGTVRTLVDIEVSDCVNLADTKGLEAQPQLKSLRLSGCTGLKGEAAFQGLTKLENLGQLYLNGCTGLTDTADLSALPRLYKLDLSLCTGLTDDAAFEGLSRQSSLSDLILTGCISLTKTDSLASLRLLTWLDLSECGGLVNERDLKGLFGLKYLSYVSLSKSRWLEPEAVRSLRKALPSKCQLIGLDGEEVKP